MDLTGPVGGAIGLISTFFPLADAGYVAEEFFLSGTATSHDGRTARYRTRIVVYRPADPAAFRGTAVVEWLNVSSGADAPAFWLLTHRHLIRSGCGWVGVSAQQDAIDGGSIFEQEYAEDDQWRSMMLPPLKKSDPERYSSLVHPGDAFGYDIFSQAGQAVRERLGPARVLAVGQSQSAAMLVTYVNDFATQVFDGYLIDGRPGLPAGLDGFDGRVSAGDVQVRDDVAPVMIVQTETDVFGVLKALPSRQPDSGQVRLWEIAGAAHADSYLIGASFTDSGALTAAELSALLTPRSDPLGVPFAAPINSGPQHHYVAQAALAALEAWVRDGTAPASAGRLTADPDGTLVTDDHGIALGGLRTPWVDVPAAVLSGLGQGDTGPGVIFGSTTPFAAATLTGLYPGGRDDYLARFGKAAEQAIAAGFLLPEDLAEILALGAAGFPR